MKRCNCLLAFGLWALLEGQATAQSHSGFGDDELPQAGAHVDDPLATGTDHFPRARPETGVQKTRVAERKGEVLTAHPAVRETTHRIEVTFAEGLAFVTESIRLHSGASTPAEVEYRVACADDARMTMLEACDAHGRCVRTATEAKTATASAIYGQRAHNAVSVAAELQAIARHRRDERGASIVVRASPIAAGGDLTLNLRYIARPTVAGRTLRFSLPARGMDPRAARAELRVEGPSSGRMMNGNPLLESGDFIEPWLPIDIVERVVVEPSPKLSLWSSPCGKETCVRLFVHASPEPASAREVVFLVDASPSTEGPARNRMMSALSSALVELPETSTVRAIAFASTARVLVGEPSSASDVGVGALAKALSIDLGSATRFEAAWATVQKWVSVGAKGSKPLIVVVGDGGLTVGPDLRKAAGEVVKHGVEVSAVVLGDRAPEPALRELVDVTHGVIVDASAAAERALRGAPDDELRGALSMLFARHVGTVRVAAGSSSLSTHDLRAGEAWTWRGITPPSRVTARLNRQLVQSKPARKLSDDFATLVKSEALAQHTNGAGDRETEHALARAKAKSVLPPESLLNMLRQRVIPVARHCFRRERGGRPDHAVRAEFVFRIEHREVVESELHGTIPEALRRCLSRAVDALAIPTFERPIVVRYPLRTQAEPPLPIIELPKDVETRIDGLLLKAPDSLPTP